MLTYFDPRFDNYLCYDNDEDYHDDAYHYSPPMSIPERDWHRRRRELEYLRQQDAAAARRRRAAQWQQQQQQREIDQRRAYQEQRLQDSQRKQRQIAGMEGEPRSLMDHRVVQGPDGRLYRFPIRRRQDQPIQSTRPEPMAVLVRGPGGRLYQVPVESAQEDQHEPMVARSDDEAMRGMEPMVERRAQSNPTTGSRYPLDKPLYESVSNFASHTDGTMQDDHFVGKPPNKRRSKVTVIVEDASDSEYEDDEIGSVWRNRRPSPGQWMEPVEY